MSKTAPFFKSIFLFVFISCAFILPLRAQQLKWASEVLGGYSQGQTVCAAPNGNVFVYGSFLDTARVGGIHLNDTASFYAAAFIASYGKSGNARWAFVVDYSTNQYIKGVAAGPYGDLYIYGNIGTMYYPVSDTLKFNNYKPTSISGGFIAKCDSNGAVKWIKRYPYINTSGFAVSGNGSLHINGYFISDSLQIGSKAVKKGVCIQNQFLATLDSGGNALDINNIATYNYATATFSIAATDSAGDIFMQGALQFGDSGYVGADTFVTVIDSPEFDHNIFFKINTKGAMVWSKEISPVIYTTVTAADAAGDFYLGGSTHNEVYFGNYVYIDPQFYDTTSYLVRFDPDGNALWGQSFYSSSALNQFNPTPYISSGISVDRQGHIYAIGTTHDASRSYFTILEFNSLGKIMWVDTILAIDSPVLVELNSYISGISASNQGSVYFTGAFDSTCIFKGASLPKPVYNGYDNTAYYGNMFIGELINKDSSRLGIENTSRPEMAIKVYPNPASQNVTIQFSSNTPAQYLISLTDLAGRQVYSSAFAANEGVNNCTFNIQNLSPGMYFLNVQNGEQVQRVKLIKE